MSRITTISYDTYNYLFNLKAPKLTGNLINSMVDKPKLQRVTIPNVFDAEQVVITLGQEFSTRTNKKNKYNYGTLLQDKRIIKNRESKDKFKRLENREKNNIKNTRRTLVKDEYGKIQRVSGNQIRHHNSSNSKQWEMVGIDHNIIPKKATTPYRVNTHYHYLDDIYKEYPSMLARVLNGKLHYGNYMSKKQKQETKDIIKQNINNLVNEQATFNIERSE